MMFSIYSIELCSIIFSLFQIKIHIHLKSITKLKVEIFKQIVFKTKTQLNLNRIYFKLNSIVNFVIIFNFLLKFAYLFVSIIILIYQTNQLYDYILLNIAFCMSHDANDSIIAFNHFRLYCFILIAEFFWFFMPSI